MARGDVLLRYDGRRVDKPVTLKHLARRHTQGSEANRNVVIEADRRG
jgi:hypothetical protein